MIYSNIVQLELDFKSKDESFEVRLTSLGRRSFSSADEQVVAVIPRLSRQFAQFGWTKATIRAKSFTLGTSIVFREQHSTVGMSIIGRFGQSSNKTSVSLRESDGYLNRTHFSIQFSFSNGKITKFQPDVSGLLPDNEVNDLKKDHEAIINKIIEIRFLPSVNRFLGQVQKVTSEKDYIARTYTSHKLDIDDLDSLGNFDSTTELIMAVNLSKDGRKIVKVDTGMGPTYFLVPENELEEFGYLISRLGQDRMVRKLSKSADRLASE